MLETLYTNDLGYFYELYKFSSFYVTFNMVFWALEYGYFGHFIHISYYSAGNKFTVSISKNN